MDNAAVTAVTGEGAKQFLAADKVKRTRKCKNILACVAGEFGGFSPISGFPPNIVSKDKAAAWVAKNAKENGGPRVAVFVRMVGDIDISEETRYKVKVR